MPSQYRRIPNQPLLTRRSSKAYKSLPKDSARNVHIDIESSAFSEHEAQSTPPEAVSLIHDPAFMRQDLLRIATSQTKVRFPLNPSGPLLHFELVHSKHIAAMTGPTRDASHTVSNRSQPTLIVKLKLPPDHLTDVNQRPDVTTKTMSCSQWNNSDLSDQEFAYFMRKNTPAGRKLTTQSIMTNASAFTAINASAHSSSSVSFTQKECHDNGQSVTHGGASAPVAHMYPKTQATNSFPQPKNFTRPSLESRSAAASQAQLGSNDASRLSLLSPTPRNTLGCSISSANSEISSATSSADSILSHITVKAPSTVPIGFVGQRRTMGDVPSKMVPAETELNSNHKRSRSKASIPERRKSHIQSDKISAKRFRSGSQALESGLRSKKSQNIIDPDDIDGTIESDHDDDHESLGVIDRLKSPDIRSDSYDSDDQPLVVRTKRSTRLENGMKDKHNRKPIKDVQDEGKHSHSRITREVEESLHSSGLKTRRQVRDASEMLGSTSPVKTDLSVLPRIFRKDLLQVKPGDLIYPVELMLNSLGKKQVNVRSKGEWIAIDDQEDMESQIEREHARLNKSRVKKSSSATESPSPALSKALFSAAKPDLRQSLGQQLETSQEYFENELWVFRSLAHHDGSSTRDKDEIVSAQQMWLSSYKLGRQHFEDVCRRQGLLPPTESKAEE